MLRLFSLVWNLSGKFISSILQMSNIEIIDIGGLAMNTGSDHHSTLDQWVFRIAGSFILVSLALAVVHSLYWLWFTAFVAANLLQASFTGFCPSAMLLRKLGVRSGTAF
jgi:hypothetical protein